MGTTPVLQPGFPQVTPRPSTAARMTASAPAAAAASASLLSPAAPAAAPPEADGAAAAAPVRCTLTKPVVGLGALFWAS